jgi:hypothetical protein
MSCFISAISAAGFSEMPPASNVTPFPARTTEARELDHPRLLDGALPDGHDPPEPVLLEFLAAHHRRPNRRAREHRARLLRKSLRRQVVAGPVPPVTSQANQRVDAARALEADPQALLVLALQRDDVDAVHLSGLVGARTETVEAIVGQRQLGEFDSPGLLGVHVARRYRKGDGDLVLPVAAGLFEHPTEELA